MSSTPAALNEKVRVALLKRELLTNIMRCADARWAFYDEMSPEARTFAQTELHAATVEQHRLEAELRPAG